MPESNKHYFTINPTINIQDMDENYNDTFVNDLEDQAQVRVYIAEERRISRLPAFDTRRLRRNELVNKEYSIVRPFECHPLEISARLATEDFNIFVEDKFSLHWYL
jgi:hypothetical protein